MNRHLLKKAEIEQLEGTNKQHFLNPNAKRINKSLGDLVGITGFGFHIIEIPPGCESTEYHMHYHEDECTYVLEGSGIVIIGDEKHEIAEGDFIGYKHASKAHTMINTGNIPLKCIVVGNRYEQDVCDYPKLNKRLYRNNQTGWNLVDINNIQTATAGKK
ncbi:cupin domain-containing protein [Thiotrichales bacterium 19X7-9]|nr:cupin domain-containing protein [Thiotrichales bacterium 19X7-9]